MPSCAAVLRPSPHVFRLLTLLFLLAARRPARAAIYDVDRIDDDATKTACTGAVNDCTLRGAIIASNTSMGADVINLPDGTYTLSIGGTGEDNAATGDLDIRDSLTITGAGQTTTIIDGAALDRVIQTDPIGGGTIAVTIQELTIQHGAAPQIAFVNAEGGGIRNGATAPSGLTAAGTLHLIDVTVDHNTSEKSGGGVSNDGVLTMVNCAITANTAGNGANGGGIAQDDEGTLSLNGTTVSGNFAEAGGGVGGGIFVGFFSTGASPVVTIDNSTISGNTARTAGGIGRNRGTLTATNSTISGNIATQSSGFGGGGIGDSGFTNANMPVMLLKSCTVTGNSTAFTDGGGGLNASGAGTKLVNTIVAGNTGNGTPSDIIGNLISAGHNLIGKATLFTVDPGSDTTGDVNGVTVANLHLGPLVHDSGPPTETHALLPGSPAIDAGSAVGGALGCANTDQRAATRPIDGDGNGVAVCDIGAYELQDVPTTPTPTTTPGPGATVTATPTGGETPTVTATPDPGDEDCDNCVDDDGDGLVDRDDPGCDQPLDGGAQGVGDPVRAKRLVKCASAIQKAGAKSASKRFARLQKCVDAVFTCAQVKNGDAKCLGKAKAACDKAIAALPGDGAKLTAVIAKVCGASVVDPGDLRAASGLAYDGHAFRCGLVGAAAPVDAASVADCVAREHACRADATLGVQVPRAAELLALVGHDASELPCLPTGTGAGLGLGDAVRGKRAAKCETAIKKAGAKLVNGEVKLVPKCANAVLACLQLAKKGCAPKSRATCAKTSVKVNALAAKLAAAITKGCEASGLTLADVRAADGIGFDALAGSCAAARVASFANIGDVTACLAHFHHCRAHQLLENEAPRLRELLGTGQLVLP